MLELIKELMEREWWFELCDGYYGCNSDGECDYHLHIHLGNVEYRVFNDEQAQELLNEIRTYW